LSQEDADMENGVVRPSRRLRTRTFDVGEHLSAVGRKARIDWLGRSFKALGFQKF